MIPIPDADVTTGGISWLPLSTTLISSLAAQAEYAAKRNANVLAAIRGKYPAAPLLISIVGLHRSTIPLADEVPHPARPLHHERHR
jgi:hypothetical protein